MLVWRKTGGLRRVWLFKADLRSVRSPPAAWRCSQSAPCSPPGRSPSGLHCFSPEPGIHTFPLYSLLIHLLLNRTEYYQLQIVSKKLTKMQTHLCIDIRVVLLFVNRTGKLVEMSADEKSWWWLKISSTVDAEKFFWDCNTTQMIPPPPPPRAQRMTLHYHYDQDTRSMTYYE